MRHVVILASVLVAAPAAAGTFHEASELASSGAAEMEPAEPAEAAPDAVIRIGDVVDGKRRRRADRVDARVRVLSSYVVVELAIRVSRTRVDTRIHEGVIELEIPNDVNATALALADGTVDLTGEVMHAELARARYDRALEPVEVRDPALLEWTRTDGERQVLTLRVAPLTPTGATATVTLQIPRTGGAGRVQLVANAPGSVELSTSDGAADGLAIKGRRVRGRRGDGRTALAATTRRGGTPIAFGFGASTAPPDGEPAPSLTFLGPSLSLIAAPTPAPERFARREPFHVCTVTVGQPIVRASRGAGTVRDVVRLYLPQVKHCFQQAVQRDRKNLTWARKRPVDRHAGEAGKVTATWMISESGAVEGASVVGFGDDKLDACITDVVRGMEFPASAEGTTRIYYPFTFALAEPVASAAVAD